MTDACSTHHNYVDDFAVLFAIKTLYALIEGLNDKEFKLTVDTLLRLASDLVHDFAFQAQFEAREAEAIGALEKLLLSVQARISTMDAEQGGTFD